MRKLTIGDKRDRLTFLSKNGVEATSLDLASSHLGLIQGQYHSKVLQTVNEEWFHPLARALFVEFGTVGAMVEVEARIDRLLRKARRRR